MKRHQVTDNFSISDQITAGDVAELARSGVELIVCNRPDGEADDQPYFSDIASAASAQGIEALAIPFKSGQLQAAHIDQFIPLLNRSKSIHAYCRTGNRSFSLFAVASARQGQTQEQILEQGRHAGFDVSALLRPYYKEPTMNSDKTYDVAIIGAGSGGIAVAASLLKRKADLSIVLIDPAREHFYQPGWTMVGGGIFSAQSTRRDMQSLIPSGVQWIQAAATEFNPSGNTVKLDNGSSIYYQQLIVAPGLRIDWAAIEGLQETLGRNGVTSNYSYQHAPYTWDLVKSLRGGRALFTQPPMPIKCAGAPQKAMYLSCDYWRKQGVLDAIDVEFHNAGGVLFGVADYVPALQSYVDKYKIDLCFNENLQAIDGDKRVAYFKPVGDNASPELIAREFDMLHVCPPQRAPDFVAQSELADAAGWLDVELHSLRHKQFENIWGLGDVMNTTNAKTMAAVRKQVPVVAQNVINALHNKSPSLGYDGYGSCPLTVERGKIVLAEFGYGGKLQPTFPTWMLQGKKASRRSWILKKDILPGIYWHAMLKGREWLTSPRKIESFTE